MGKLILKNGVELEGGDASLEDLVTAAEQAGEDTEGATYDAGMKALSSRQVATLANQDLHEKIQRATAQMERLETVGAIPQDMQENTTAEQRFGTVLKTLGPIASGMLPVPGAGLAPQLLTYALRAGLAGGSRMMGEAMANPNTPPEKLLGQGAQEGLVSLGTDLAFGPLGNIARGIGGPVLDAAARTAGGTASIAGGELAKEAIGGEPAQMPGWGTAAFMGTLGAFGAKSSANQAEMLQSLEAGKAAAQKAFPAGTPPELIDTFAPVFAEPGTRAREVLRELLATDYGRSVYAQAMRSDNVAKKMVTALEGATGVKLDGLSAEKVTDLLGETQQGLQGTAARMAQSVEQQAIQPSGMAGVDRVPPEQISDMTAQMERTAAATAEGNLQAAAQMKAQREAMLAQAQAEQAAEKARIETDFNARIHREAQNLAATPEPGRAIPGRADRMGNQLIDTARSHVYSLAQEERKAWDVAGKMLTGPEGQMPVNRVIMPEPEERSVQDALSYLRKVNDGQFNKLADSIEDMLFPGTKTDDFVTVVEPPTLARVAEATREISRAIGALPYTAGKEIGALDSLTKTLLKTIGDSVPTEVSSVFFSAREKTRQLAVSQALFDKLAPADAVPSDVWKKFYQAGVEESPSMPRATLESMLARFTSADKAAMNSAFNDAWATVTSKGTKPPDVDRLIALLDENRYTHGLTPYFQQMLKQHVDEAAAMTERQGSAMGKVMSTADSMALRAQKAEEVANSVRMWMDSKLSTEMLNMNPAAFKWAETHAAPLAFAQKVNILRDLMEQAKSKDGIFDIDAFRRSPKVEQALSNPTPVKSWFPELEAVASGDLNALRHSRDGARKIKAIVELFDGKVGKVSDLVPFFLDNRNITTESVDLLFNAIGSLKDGKQKLSALRTAWLRSLVMSPVTGEINPRLWSDMISGHNAFPSAVLEKLAGGKPQAEALKKWSAVFNQIDEVGKLLGERGGTAIRQSADFRKMIELMDAGSASMAIEALITGSPTTGAARRGWFEFVVFKTLFGRGRSEGLLEILTSKGIESWRERIYNHLTAITKLGSTVRQDWNKRRK